VFADDRMQILAMDSELDRGCWGVESTLAAYQD
jgi:hypothetical protein